MANEKRIVQQIIKKYGETINLRERPDILIDILRRFHIAGDDGPDGGTPPAPEPSDGGGLPGGVPPSPPPGPSSIQGRPSIDDVMREVLKISRVVAKINQQIGGVAAPAPKAGAAAAKKK